MAGLYDGLEEASFFKRPEGGYIFRSRSPWYFGPSRNYLVSEAEKVVIAAEIRATLRTLKPIVWAAMIILPIFLIGAVTLMALSGWNRWIIHLFAFATSVLYIGSMHQYSRRRLRPLIANLPRTSQKISFRTETANLSAHVPPKLLLLLLSCAALGFVFSLLSGVDALVEGHLSRSLPTALPAVILSGLCTIYLSKLFLDRRKSKQERE